MTMHMEGVASPSGTLPPILAGETQAVMDQLAGLYADLLGDMMDVTFTMETRDTLTAEGDFYIYPQGYNESSADRSAFGMHMNVVNADGEGGFANIEGYYSPADGVYYDYDEFAPHRQLRHACRRPDLRRAGADAARGRPRVLRPRS